MNGGAVREIKDENLFIDWLIDHDDFFYSQCNVLSPMIIRRIESWPNFPGGLEDERTEQDAGSNRQQ